MKSACEIERALSKIAKALVLICAGWIACQSYYRIGHATQPAARASWFVKQCATFIQDRD